MKVQANREYIYYPNMLDRIDGRTKLVPGSIVRVVNLPGCPRANTMGHAHVEYNGQFAGLVHTNSLHSLSDRQLVIDAIKRDLRQDSPIRVESRCVQCGYYSCEHGEGEVQPNHAFVDPKRTAPPRPGYQA